MGCSQLLGWCLGPDTDRVSKARVPALTPVGAFLCRVVQKQMAFMLGRHGVFLELNEDVEEYEDLTEIMSNVQLNSNFLALAREVRPGLGGEGHGAATKRGWKPQPTLGAKEQAATWPLLQGGMAAPFLCPARVGLGGGPEDFLCAG